MNSVTPSKCAAQLTNDAWPGWLMAVGHHASTGVTQGWTAAADTVIVWSGGTSSVSILSRGVERIVRRQSGMIDVLPAGTVLERIQWHGEATGSVSTVLQPERAAAWLGEAYSPFDPEQDFRVAVTDAHIVDLVRHLQAQAVARQPLGRLYVEALSLTLASYVYGRYSTRARVPLERDVGARSGFDVYGRPANTNSLPFRGVPGSSGGLPQAQRERLIAFVEDNLGASIGLTELASLIGYGADHFSRLFKLSFGVPPYQYVLERRVERAKAMLKNRHRSILEVALNCGFASQAHLNVAFKRRTGVTPGVYRRG